MAIITDENSRPMAIAASDVQIPLAPRVAEFDRRHNLTDDARLLVAAIEGRERELTTQFWTFYSASKALPVKPTAELIAQATEHGIDYTRAKFGDPCAQRWADIARDFAWSTAAAGVPVAALLAGLDDTNRLLTSWVVDRYGRDPVQLKRALAAAQRIAVMEAEIMSSFLAELREHQLRRERTEQADLFQSRIVSNVTETSKLGSSLRSQAANASDATRGMLGKASEVAAAAEQSATAMRDAAQTAAGLIRAIEEARGEVELSAEVANRAAAEAGEAVKVSELLSDTAKSIESILSLIRDVAGQTNLLALNATIEAARAGDAGRGFAVVAQEVKSLANQTARATDDIASKISAIQSATRTTVQTNGAIRDIVTEVQASAARIRRAMEDQAQTVTMITAAVDETALAADTMSSTIAAIRADTENVAGEIDALEGGFETVNAKLASLKDAAGAYVKLVA